MISKLGIRGSIWPSPFNLTIRDTFTRAVRTCSNIPVAVRNAAPLAIAIERSSFDSTYINLLTRQIELNARGDEWSKRLTERKSGLAKWCDTELIGGKIECGPDDYTIYVEPLA